MTRIAHALLAANYADRVATALGRLRQDDSMAYPREAHHSYLVASALEVAGHAPILEADYWRGYYTERPGTGPRKRPRADVWCASAFGDETREIFVEIKLAGLWRGRRGIGTKDQRGVISSWAEDIWRLLVGTNRAHCGFILCAYSDNGTAWSQGPTTSSGVATTRLTTDADQAYEAILATRADTAIGAVTDFVATCKKELGADITCLPPASNAVGLHVWPVVVEWNQDGGCESPWVVK